MKLFLLLLLLVVFISGCNNIVGGDDDIIGLTREKIEVANYCNVDDDCVDAGGVCPFGCHIYVNEAELEDVRAAIKYYNSNVNQHCAYDCAPCPSVECVSGKCEAVCDF